VWRNQLSGTLTADRDTESGRVGVGVEVIKAVIHVREGGVHGVHEAGALCVFKIHCKFVVECVFTTSENAGRRINESKLKGAVYIRWRKRQRELLKERKGGEKKGLTTTRTCVVVATAMNNESGKGEGEEEEEEEEEEKKGRGR